MHVPRPMLNVLADAKRVGYNYFQGFKFKGLTIDNRVALFPRDWKRPIATIHF